MIYTIGHEETYDKALISMSKDFCKLGHTDNLYGSGEEYQGGSVWELASDAMEYLKANMPRLSAHAVFAVDADWENGDTLQIGNEPFRRLRVTSQILHKCPRGVL